MARQRIIKDTTSISELFKNLERQKEISVNIRFNDKQLQGVLVFNNKASEEPVITYSNDFISLENGDIVEISFFYKDTYFEFETRVIDAVEKAFCFIKPHYINASFGRSSTRYLVKKDENISIKINGSSVVYKVVDISTSGLSIEASENILKTGQSIRNSLLFINDIYIYFDADIKYIKHYKNTYVYGLNFINIEWEASQVIFKYIFGKVYPNIKSISDYTREELSELYSKQNYSGARIVGYQKNLFGNEIKKFDSLIYKPTISVNLAYNKNNNVTGAISAQRIFNRTFMGYPPVLLPDTYLNPKANVDIFIGLAEHLLNHPYFENYLTYINADLDWYQNTFQNIYRIINDNDKFKLDSCIFYTFSVDDSYSECLPSQLDTEILDEPDEFLNYCENQLTGLERACFSYNCRNSFLLSEIKSVYHSLGYSMSRKVFRIKEDNNVLAYAVAECYNEEVNYNNSLDGVRVYFIEGIKDKNAVLQSLLTEVSSYYKIKNCRHFRVCLPLDSDLIPEKNTILPDLGPGDNFQRILMNKDGLLEFVRLLKANFEFYTKFYNLSQPQKSIWYTEKVYPGTSIGNIIGTLKIKEEVDVDLLEKAINLFVEKNDAMRIRVIEENDIPKQYICNYSYFKVDFFDFSECQIKDYYKWDEQQSTKVFELTDSSLYYFAILKFKSDLYAFYANTHHLISDAWTMSLLGGEIFEFYKSLKNNVKISKAKKPSYLEYVLSEEEYKFSDKYEKNKEFWSRMFDTMPEFISFKTDVNFKSVAANRKTFVLPEAVSRNIKSYCKKMKASVFTLFFSVLSLYISRRTGCEDIVIGTPILNRSGVKEKETVGMFINSVPVRLQINHNMEFAAFLNYVTREINTCLKNQKYNYDLILSDFRSKYKVASKLFDVVISYQNSKYEKGDNGDDLEARWHFNYNQIDSLVIHIDDREDDGQYIIKFDYLTDIFSDDEIEKIFSYIIKLIEGVNIDPECVLKDLSMLEDRDKEKLDHFIENYNKTDSIYPKDKGIHQLFEEQAGRTPDFAALEYDGKTMTYAELNNKANQLARRLIEKGIRNDRIVALMLDRSFELVIGILGILKAGGAYLPLDPDYPKDRIDYMLENSEAVLLLSEEKYIDKTSFSGEIINLNDHKLFSGNDKDLINVCNTDNLAYIIYTSGSTGKPKGTMITQKGLVNYITWADKMYVRGDAAAFALYSSISFDLTVTSVFTPLISGNKIVIYNNDSSELLIQKIFREKKVQVVKLTPAHLKLVKDMDNRNSSIQRLILGGEDLKTGLCREIHESFHGNVEIYNEYGPTETVVGCMIYKFNYEADKRNSVPIGVPADNVQIYLLDKYLNPVPYGMSGEMYISGDGVARGYLNMNKLTSERFLDNPFLTGKRMYRTGDLAAMLPDGNMEYLGRIDSQVKINGYRIELGEVESEILKCDYVKSAVVLDLNQDGGRKYLCAYIIKKNEFKLSDLKNALKKVLPSYMVPSSYIFIDKIPLTSNGKIDRKVLENLTHDESEISDYVAPTNILERYLEEVIGNILGMQRISIEDNFFDLGLDSLSIMQIVSTLMSKGWELTIQDIYNHSTIKSLCDKLTSDSKAESYAAAAELAGDLLIKKIELTPIPDKVLTREFKHILLTGATGYLGIHLLHELLLGTEAKVYCLVKDENKYKAKEQLKSQIEHYYPEDLNCLENDRIAVLAGDITLDRFGLNDEDYTDISKKVDVVFHLAALVKLFGNYDDIKKVNIDGTKRITDFCIQYNKALRYASTVAVSGNYHVQQSFSRVSFSEADFDIGQYKESNYYVKSKYEAEKIILEKSSSGLDAVIFRIGDLISRNTDYTFQFDVTKKFSLNIMKSLIEVGIIPDHLLNEEVEFTPVDLASKAILLLSKLSFKKPNVFHIFNHNRFFVSTLFFDVLEPLGYKFEVIDKCTFNEYMDLIKKKTNRTDDIIFLENNFNFDNMLGDQYRVELKSEYTIEYLKKLGFKWPIIDRSFLEKAMINLIKIKFLN